MNSPATVIRIIPLLALLGALAAAPAAHARNDAFELPVDKALAGNTRAICDQAARASTSFGETFIADIKLQIDAASQGAAAKTQAQQKIDRDVASYSSALAGMAELSDDKSLKAALIQMSRQVRALTGDVAKINADEMSKITATLDKTCGNG